MSKLAESETNLVTILALSSSKIKDLEKEVEEIMSQEDTDEELKSVELTPPRRWLHSANMELATPGSKVVRADAQQTVHRSAKMELSTPRDKAFSVDAQQGLRRSTRKSIKPAQDYDEIISTKTGVRSTSKGQHKEEMDSQAEEPQPKWTPAKVGRVSQKRGRKSRKTGWEKLKLKLNAGDEDTEHEEEKSDTQTVTMKRNEGTEQAQPIEAEHVESVDTKQEEKKDLTQKTVAVVASETMTTNKELIIIDLSEMDMADLGLNPLKDDDSDVDLELEKFPSAAQTELIKIVDEEVPACKDNQENEKGLEKIKKQELEENSQSGAASVTIKENSSNNDTFNTSECIFVECSGDKMEPLQISDDDSEKAADIPRIIITSTEDAKPDVVPIQVVTPQRTVEVATPKHTVEVAIPKHTVEVTTPKHTVEVTTPKQTVEVATPKHTLKATPRRISKVACRIPTPYKRIEVAISDKKVQKQEPEQLEDDGEKENKPVVPEKSSTVTVTVSTLEPKEIVLRSIRKRSLSMCVGNVVRKQPRAVTFHSPANQTVVIEEFDSRMPKNDAKKQEDGASFVTKRRKRSMSFDESALSSATKLARSNLCGNTPSKLRPTPQKVVPMRTKLPNFAAIHQKQFAKMENLVEHVNRKAERAKILSNSAVKLDSVSAQKNMPSKIPHMNLTAADKPKALKKINLDTSTKPVAAVAPAAAPLSLTVSHTIETVAGESKVVHLPKPQLAIIRPRNNAIATKKSPTQPSSAKKVLKPRPRFNLSTSTQSLAPKVNAVKPNVQMFTAKVAAAPNISAVHAPSTAPSVPLQSFENKIATRRQKHMDMFKGRVGGAGSAGRKNGDIIRGVRSNRRFELQMQHRQNLDHN